MIFLLSSGCSQFPVFGSLIMKVRNLSAVLIAGFIALITPAAAGPDVDVADAWIRHAMKEYGVPGAGVVIIFDGKPLLVRGYGVRDLLDSESAVDADTLFQLASVSKTFTSAAAAVAVDRKKLRWDQPVVELIPNLELSAEYPTRHVTVIDFLVHRAGFPGFFGDLFDHLGFTRPEVIARLREIVPAYSFRNHPEYSNIGFFLAGETAAAALENSYEEVVQKHLLDPLGMTRTVVSSQVPGRNANAARPHALVEGELRPVPNNSSALFVAAGGYSSSANDLAPYLQMLLEGGKWQGVPILSEDGVKALFQPWITSEGSFAEFPPIGPGSGFAFTPGWGAYSYNNHQVIEKGGALDGFRAILMLVPDRRLAVGVVCNKNLTAFPEAVRAWVLQQVLGQPGEADLQPEIAGRGAQVAAIFAKPPGPPANAAAPSREFADFVGIYESPLFGSWRVVKNEGDDVGTFPLVVFAGPAEYRGKIRRWDGNTLAVEWPIVLHFPSEMKFDFSDSTKPAVRFTFEGYEFARSE
jgi:CubicO group peptidase (beta-lactamase class C family)